MVYAIPTRPVSVDYVNNEDAIFVPETEAVVIESEEPEFLPPKNVTILEFPEKEAEPSLQVDEEDEELGKICIIKAWLVIFLVISYWVERPLGIETMLTICFIRKIL